VSELPAQPSLRRIKAFGIRPVRELGQNFLIDSNLLGVIARAAALGRADVVLEVGGGLGVLSEYLAERAAQIIEGRLRTAHAPARVRAWKLMGAPQRLTLSQMPMRVGFDLVAVAAVEHELQAPTRDRYLARVYTEREVAECTTDRGVSAERLAARFAAKEATIKVLPPSTSGFALREIEARRTGSGRVEMELTGAAAALASDSGIIGLSVSLTHEAGIAGAVVIAEYRAPL